jgi:branched-chain amino acid transport system permease protein
VDFIAIQFLNGLASASSLFLVSAGLSIIFGVTRIVNFAHGSLYMLGAYIAYNLVQAFANSPMGFWLALPLAALVVAGIGALLEVTVLRRIYKAPELFQLVATFGVALIIQDLVVILWGPEDLLGPKAPGLEGAVQIFGHAFPTYELALIGLGPTILVGLWWLFRYTRWGILVRAATEDREMVAALGINERWLFTSVFILGAFLAGLGGAVQLPREAVHHAMDLQIIVEAFVVVVIGGLGSVPGAFLAAVLIEELNAFGILVFPNGTLVLAFIAMAIVLVIRPWGLLGDPESAPRTASTGHDGSYTPLTEGRRNTALVVLIFLAIVPVFAGSYAISVMTEVLIFVLFAASLHFMLGVGGMVSFGHAAYFGLGAYGAALLVMHSDAPMEVALLAGPVLAALGAVVFGWFCVRLSGVYLAMLTLAFAQISWSIVFQWYDVTGGDNGIIGVWPSAWASDPKVYYYVTLAVVTGCIIALRALVFSPYGYALRACRDSGLRSEAVGLDRRRLQWLGFVLAGVFAGVAGSLYAFLKGSVFPDAISIPLSVDGLVMVLLGGVHTLTGPIVGAVLYTALQTVLSSYTEYWRMIIGVIIVALCVAFPRGVVGYLAERFQPLERQGSSRNSGAG